MTSVVNVMSLMLVLGAILLSGGCANAGSGVGRVDSDPVVPESAMRDSFVGTWIDEDGEVNCAILRRESGEVVVVEEDNEIWDSVVNNVRFKGNELCFDLYYYYVGTEDMSLEIPEAGIHITDHPYSGVCNFVRLTPQGENAQGIVMSITTKDISDPVKSKLTRANP